MRRIWKLAVFYRIPVLFVAAIVLAATTEKLIDYFLLFAKIDAASLFYGFYITVFRVVAFMIWLALSADVIRKRYYKHQTGRNLAKDQKQTQLTYSKLLSRYRQEALARNPKVPKELQHKIPTGIFFGRSKRENKYVCKPATFDGACLIIGGAGSGKSSCCIIKTIRDSWKQAIFAIDIKGELSRKGLSKEQRENVKIFAPADPSSEIGFDPFYLAKQTTNPVQSIREIALALIEKPENIKDPYWITAAQNVFTGAMLYGLSQKMSFLQVVQWLLSSDPESVIEKIKESGCESANAYVSQYATLKEETLGSIFSEVINHLIVFGTDPEVSGALLRENIITPEDLEQGTSIFLEIPEEKLEQWKGLLTVIVNLFLKAFERRSEGKAPILMLLDETPRMGKLRLVEGLSTLRSRGIHIVPVIQSISQLDMIYGKDARKIITDNCPYKVVMGAGDSETMEWLSRLCGTYQKTAISYSHSQQDLDYEDGKSVTISEQEKRVIRPEEFGYMTDIVLLNPINGFCRIEKVPYYK